MCDSGDLIIKDEADDYKGEAGDSEEDEDESLVEKEPSDVSHYTLEEKIVAAVWVHERVRNNMTWDAMMKNFGARFRNKPPSKQTLLCWERKLFTTGNAHDKIRTGRPIARLMHVPYVKQSIEEQPNLSIRERAKELGLPYATLLKILKEDLKMAYVPDICDPPKKKSTLSNPNTSGKWRFIDSPPKKQRLSNNGGNKIKSETTVLSSSGTSQSNTFNSIPDGNQASSSFDYGIPSNSMPTNTTMVPSVSMYQNFANY